MRFASSHLPALKGGLLALTAATLFGASTPLLQYFGVAATLRASLAFYNTHDEIERFAAALEKARRLLA